SGDRVPGRYGEALWRFELCGEWLAEKRVADPREQPAGIARRHHRGLCRDVMPIGASEFAARGNDPHITIARPASLLWYELLEARQLLVRLARRLHDSRIAPKPSTTCQQPAQTSQPRRNAPSYSSSERKR